MVAMIDPLRPEAGEAVARCGKAGVKVVMVTGDNPGTALAVARDAGIAAGPDDVITGRNWRLIASIRGERRASIPPGSRRPPLKVR